MGGIFNNCQRGVVLSTPLDKTDHPQITTTLLADNYSATGAVKEPAKKRKSTSINMQFYWVRDHVQLGNFHIF